MRKGCVPSLGLTILVGALLSGVTSVSPIALAHGRIARSGLSATTILARADAEARKMGTARVTLHFAGTDVLSGRFHKFRDIHTTRRPVPVNSSRKLTGDQEDRRGPSW